MRQSSVPSFSLGITKGPHCGQVSPAEGSRYGQKCSESRQHFSLGRMEGPSYGTGDLEGLRYGVEGQEGPRHGLEERVGEFLGWRPEQGKRGTLIAHLKHKAAQHKTYFPLQITLN